MAEIQLRSYQQILGSMIAKLLAETDLNDVSPGSVFLTTLEAAASSDFTQEGKLLQLLNIRNPDKAKGADLENLASEMGVSPPRIGANSARVKLRITDSAFTKVSTTVFAGAVSPAAGDTTLKATDATAFSASGTIYIGRGTSTSEAIAYIGLTNTGTYWLFTLASPLTKDHLVGEEIVMAQGGDRTIPSGTVVKVPPVAGSPSIEFTTSVAAVIADGEDTINNVEAVANTPDSTSNVGIGKITEFDSPPFSTAEVTNDEPASGGRDSETDSELRQRIKDHVHDLGKGTQRAIIRAVIGVNDPDEKKVVVSAFLREPTEAGQLGVLFIDDGTGFAPIFSGVGEETIITSAAGTEQFFQLQQFPVVKAQIVSVGVEPFNVVGGERLLVDVDGESEERAIPGTDYRSPGVVTAQEIVESINKNFTTVEARAKDGRVFITPISDDPDYIRIGTASSSDINSVLRFPTRKQFTIRLYRNDVLLEKNGSPAKLQSNPNSSWSPFGPSETLQLEIDGISAGTITFTDSDFATLTSSLTIMGASPADWAIVFNAKVIGITAVGRDDGTFTIESNKGKSTAASLEILGGSLAGNLFKAGDSSVGKVSDFKFNRLLGQIELTDSLNSGDELKAGNTLTAGFAVTPAQATYDLSTTLGSPAKMIFITDASVEILSVNQLAGSLTFSSPSSGVQRITGAVGQFSVVKSDDYMFLYNLTTNGTYRVKGVATNGSYVDLFHPDPAAGVDTPNANTKKFVFFRTAGMPQEISFTVGAAVPAATVVSDINSKISGGIAELLDSDAIRIKTLRLDGNGALGIPAFAGTASNLQILAKSYESNDPHTAAMESADLAGLPSGKLLVSTPDLTSPFTDFQVTGTPFSAKHHNRPVLEYISGSGKLIREPKEKLTTSQLDLRNEIPFQNIGLGLDIRAVTTDALEFGESDNMVFIVDDDAAKKTFDVPMYVDGVVAAPSVPTTTQFDGVDLSGDLFGSSTRWTGHRFEDYRIWFKARKDVSFNVANTQMRIQAVQFGPNGKNIDFGIFYPTAPSSSPRAVFSIDAANKRIPISLYLGSDAERAINMTSGLSVTITSTGPVLGLYTIKAAVPDSVDLSTVVVGDIVSLNDTAFNAANRVQMKVSAVSDTIGSKYVEGKKAVAGFGETISTTDSNAIKIYPMDATANISSSLQSDINSTAGVKDLILSANATGSTGAGVINTSTEEILANGDFREALLNGESFIYSTSGASPVLRIKEPMDLVPEIGESFKLIPMTPQNIKDHLSRKQISGLSIAANVDLVSGARKVQISSKTTGGAGQIYAVGGKASGNNVLNIRGNGQSVSSLIGQFDIDHSALDLIAPGHRIYISQTGRAKKSYVGSAPTALTTVEIQTVSPTIAKILFGVPLAAVLSYTHTGSVIWAVRTISRGRVRFEVLEGTATVPATLTAGDWVLIGDGSSYAGTTPTQFFAAANQGTYQVRETDASTYFDIDLNGVDQFVTATSAPFVFFPYHSAKKGDQLSISAAAPLSSNNKGTFVVTTVVSATEVEFESTVASNEGPTALGAGGVDSIHILDSGFSTYRTVALVAPSQTDPTNKATVVVEPGYDISLLNEGQGAKTRLPNRLGFGTDPVNGMSGYQYWTGLKRRVQRTLDGYEPDPINFPGVRAAGVAIEAREPQIQRVKINAKIKTKEGVALAAISDSIKSSVVGFINSLGLGQDVILSEIVSIMQSVAGVEAVVLVDPTLDAERITVQDKAIVRASASDITLS